MYKSYFADIEGKCKYRITLFDRKRLDNSYYLINSEFEEIKLLNDSIIIDNGESLNLTFFLNQEQIFSIIDINKEIYCLVHRMNDIYYQYDDYQEKDTDEEDLTQNLIFFGKLQKDIFNHSYTEEYTELQLKFNYILEEYKKVDILKDYLSKYYLSKYSEYLNVWELIQYIAKNSLYDKIYLNVNRDFRDEKYNKNIFQNMIISRSYLEEKQDLNIYDFLFDLLDFVNYDIKIYENKLYLIDKSIYTFNEIETYFITYSLYYGEIDKNVLNITEKEVIKHYSYINEGIFVYDTEPKEINNNYFFSNDSNISVREGVNKYIFKEEKLKYENISLDNDINNFELLESTSKESAGKKEERGTHSDYFYNRLYYREDGNGNFYNIDIQLSSTEGNREGLSVVNYFENSTNTDNQLFYKMGLFPNFSDTDKENFDFIENVTFHSYEILDNMGRTTNKDKIINNRQFANIEAFRKNQFACFIDYYHSNTKNSFRPISELKRAFYISNSEIYAYQSLVRLDDKAQREQNLLQCPIIEIETKKFNLTDKQHLVLDFDYKLFQNNYHLPILRTGVNEDLDVDLDWYKPYIWVKIEANGLYYDSDKKGFYKENKPTKLYIDGARDIYKGTALKPINTLDNKNFESKLNNGFVIYNNLKGINNISLKISFYPPNMFMFINKIEVSNVLLENLKLDYVDIVDYKLLRNKREKTNKDRKIDKYLEKEINLNFHSVNEQDEEKTIYKNTLLYQDYNNNKVEYYPNFVIYGNDFDFIDLYRNIYKRKENKATIEFNSTLYDNFIYDNFLESFYKYKFIPNKIFHIGDYKWNLLNKELNITFLENM